MQINLLGWLIFHLIVAVCDVLGKCVVCYLFCLHEVFYSYMYLEFLMYDNSTRSKLHFVLSCTYTLNTLLPLMKLYLNRIFK